MRLSTADAVLVHALPVPPAADSAAKIGLPDIPTKEIVRKTSPWAISLAVILFVVAGGFWMNASTIITILASPDRIERLEQMVAHCHEDKVRLEVEIHTLRNRVVELERAALRAPSFNQ